MHMVQQPGLGKAKIRSQEEHCTLPREWPQALGTCPIDFSGASAGSWAGREAAATQLSAPRRLVCSTRYAVSQVLCSGNPCMFFSGREQAASIGRVLGAHTYKSSGASAPRPFSQHKGAQCGWFVSSDAAISAGLQLLHVHNTDRSFSVAAPGLRPRRLWSSVLERLPCCCFQRY